MEDSHKLDLAAPGVTPEVKGAVYSNSAMRESHAFKRHTKLPDHVHVGDMQIVSAPERPPVPTWTPAEAQGPEARNPAGRDMEALALSVMGKRIDDGLGADGCMHSVSAHILKSTFACDW